MLSTPSKQPVSRLYVDFHAMSGWRDEITAYIQGAIQQHLTEDSPRAEQPESIKMSLRPHQLSLLAAARNVESKASISAISLEEPQLLTRYGVIADRVGAGKSLVALSLVKDPPVKQAQFTLREGGIARILGLKHLPEVQPFREEWRSITDGAALWKELLPTSSSKFYTNTSLLIVPHNVVPQWASYIRTQTTLKALIVAKTKDCDYERPSFYADVLTADLVVVSCTMIRKFIGAMCFYGTYFQKIVWSRLFVDEADSIVLTLRPADVAARFMWFITGSWVNMLFPSGLWSHTVQELIPEIRTLIGGGKVPGMHSNYNIMAQSVSDTKDARFASLVLRNTEEWINTSLLSPTIVHTTILCAAPVNIGILREFITPAAMEALHAGDTAGALAALGLKAASKETLVDRVTASLRGDLIQAEKILAFKRDITYSSANAQAEAIKKAEGKVERIKTQLASLELRVASATSELCPICYDTPQTTTLTPCCRQAFCLSCICECISAKPACPLCRVPIPSPKELLVLGDTPADSGSDEGGEGEGDDPTKLPTKGAALLRLLTDESVNPDARFLVFSAHEASFKGLRELLSARGIRCELLQGSAARVERLRKQFREGEVKVLCMNARHVGAGINLEAATHVVLYHRMNMELERQVIGRAVRFERTAELRVVHLAHESETMMNGASGSEVIVHV